MEVSQSKTTAQLWHQKEDLKIVQSQTVDTQVEGQQSDPLWNDPNSRQNRTNVETLLLNHMIRENVMLPITTIYTKHIHIAA